MNEETIRAAIAFISAGLDLKTKKVAQWLDDEFEK